MLIDTYVKYMIDVSKNGKVNETLFVNFERNMKYVRLNILNKKKKNITKFFVPHFCSQLSFILAKI